MISEYKKQKRSRRKWDFSQSLLQARRLMHLTQAEMADMLHVPRSTYAEWERAYTMPWPVTFRALLQNEKLSDAAKEELQDAYEML